MRCMSAVKVTQGRAQPQAAAVMLCVLLFSPVTPQQPTCYTPDGSFLGGGVEA